MNTKAKLAEMHVAKRAVKISEGMRKGTIKTYSKEEILKKLKK